MIKPASDRALFAASGLVAGLLALLPSCESGPSAGVSTATQPACIADHPAGAVATAAALAQQATCVQDQGTGCQASQFISQAAAECLAQQAGLAAGIAPWRSDLSYH